MGTTLRHRAATFVLERAAMRLWGFPPNLMRDIAEQVGPGRSVAWFVRNMPRYERTRSRFGPVRTHVLCTTISVVNGCRYCTRGHAYALQLAYFDRHDALLPLDEDEIADLGRLGEDKAFAELAGALRSSGLDADVEVAERLLALRAGSAVPTTEDDRRLRHLLDMMGVLNTCAIRADTAVDQAHSPSNKDADLKRRYAERRAEARTGGRAPE